jgi:pimeloyl-ACP methyl ester carboxylesterase
MATIVIVHGAWGGTWEWRDVANDLSARGHTVVTPSLAGLGNAAHRLDRSIGLATHASDVADAVEVAGLDDIVLAGHSYGGMVITAAASLLADRIRSLVYVDAFIPEDGERESDLLDPEMVSAILTGPAEEVGDGWLVPFPFPDDLEDLTSEAAERYRSSMHPLATFTDPVRVTDAVRALPSILVRCTDKEPGTDAFERSAVTARERGWPIIDVHSGHDVQLLHPREIAQVLHDIAAAPPG